MPNARSLPAIQTALPTAAGGPFAIGPDDREGFEGAWQAMKDAERTAFAAEQEAVQAHKVWFRSLPPPKVHHAVQASRTRAHLAHVMGLNRPDDLPRALAGRLNPNLRGPEQLSLLAAAVVFGNARSVRLLLRAGANPNQPGACKPGLTVYTPLLHLLRESTPDLGKLKLLLAAGADPNAMSPKGHIRPLYYVARRAGEDVHAREAALQLLAAGADPFLPNAEGTTVWDGVDAKVQDLMRTAMVAREARLLNAVARVRRRAPPAATTVRRRL